MAGVATGEPITCRCGREMVVLFSEETRTRTGQHLGMRYVYRCGGCPRRLEVRWMETHVPQGEPRGAA